MSYAKESRSHRRFDPEENALAVIHPEAETPEGKIVGLMRDESYEGFAAIFRADRFNFGLEEELTVTAGRLGPLAAEVEWVEAVDEKFVKAGFKFCDFDGKEKEG